MTPDVGIFDSIFKSFTYRNELLNEEEIQNFKNILGIITNYIKNDEQKFNNVFSNVFSSQFFGNTPVNYDKIHQVLNIMFEFDTSLLKRIFKKEKELNDDRDTSYLSLYNKKYISDDSIWKTCNWNLYKSALKTNFYNSYDDQGSIKISKNNNPKCVSKGKIETEQRV